MSDETHFCLCHHPSNKHTEQGSCLVTGCECKTYKRDANLDRRLGDRASIGDVLYGATFRTEDSIERLKKPNIGNNDRENIFADMQLDERVLYRSLARARKWMNDHQESLKKLREWETEAVGLIRRIEDTKLSVFTGEK